MVGQITELLSATDTLHVHGEYKLWIYQNYILSLLCFHLMWMQLHLLPYQR